MRDKLIKLIKSRRDPCDIGACPFVVDDVRPCSLCETESLADHLISHGVTFADVPDNNVGDIKPMTNADRIRAMTDEELAESIVSNTYVGACVDFGIPNNKPCCGDCRKCDVVLDWIRQPMGE